MSVDPDQPSAADPTSIKPPTDAGGESAESLRAKRRFKKGTESEEGEKPDQTIELLSTLLQDLIAKKEQPGAPEAETKTAKYHRLSKTGTGAPNTPLEPNTTVANVPSVAPLSTASPVELSQGIPSAPPALPSVTFRPAPVREPSFRRKWLWLCLLGLAVFLALTYLTVVYFTPMAKKAGPETKLSPPPAGAWTDGMLNQLDQALAADQAGDLPGARRLANALKKPDTTPPPGLDLYLASLASRQEHTYDVEADLLRAVNNVPPETAAALNERLAFNFSRVREFEKANDFFRAASRLDPFSAPLFYHWGDTLRHLGRFQEATNVFRLALARVPTGQPEVASLRECIELKQRLALVEQGRDAEFQAAMAEQLKSPMPSGYWLLTAAAVALQHKSMPEAAGLLGRARDALGAESFDELLNDYFFRAYADRKELADYFPPDPAARRAKLLPTMTYTVDP